MKKEKGLFILTLDFCLFAYNEAAMCLLYLMNVKGTAANPLCDAMPFSTDLVAVSLCWGLLQRFGTPLPLKKV